MSLYLCEGCAHEFENSAGATVCDWCGGKELRVLAAKTEVEQMLDTMFSKGNKMEEDIATAIAGVLGVKAEEVTVYASTVIKGSVTFPCFSLAKKLKMPPGAIAKKLEAALGGWADGPYYKWKE